MGAKESDCGSTSDAAVARLESELDGGGGQCSGRLKKSNMSNLGMLLEQFLDIMGSVECRR